MRRSLCAVVIGVAVMHLSGGGEHVAHAQDAAPVPARRVVEVLVAGGGSDAASLDDTVRELLGRLSLVMESQSVGRIDTDDASFRSAARPHVLARVGIDLRARDVAIVTIVDGRTGAVTVRRSVRRDGPPAVVREEVAHVVQAAVDPMVLAERDRIAAEPPPPPPPPPAPEPVAEAAPPEPPVVPVVDAPPSRDRASGTSESRPLALDLSTMAGGGSFASGAGVVARAGGGAALVWRRGVRPSIGLAAQYVFPFDTGAEVALAHVGVASFRGAVGLEVYGSPLFAIDVGAGGGVDLLHVDPRSNALPKDRLGADTGRVDPIATASVTGHLAIGAGTALSLMLAADVDFASRHWVVEGPGGPSEAFSPSRVRPLLLIGFTFTAAGDARFASREPSREPSR
ncbi:MAG: hypothetical protein JWO86_3731 [Myxococcaceae bacterium]|nr:hypothetical protein [Myxococcaceae bacterium]